MTTQSVARVVAFYESISSADIARLGELYAADAFFKDPFNEVRGVPAIARIFEHMFVQVDAPRFKVRETVAQGDSAFLVWDFEFAFRRPLPAGPRRIRGCSHLRFDADGRVAFHRDYWDAAEELYEQLPAIGVLMRWLRRRGAVSQHR
ncbi:MAG: nuclear transport factor 2 family protein [Burkholderiales bacterium]|nr:MAG: nuclear transport factor 2 family protein [Burkholderiales bacterium]